MPREVNGSQPYQDKLVKVIPTEVVGAFMVLNGMLGFGPTPTPASDKLNDILIQIVFFGLLALTPFYLWKVTEVNNGIQIIVTMVSYIVWVYTLGGPFLVWKIGTMPAYHERIASVVLVFWSLIAPLLVPEKPVHPLNPAVAPRDNPSNDL